eukprot:TRINITY_DN19691_c0_g1_i1.p1 TRINITY_DN19691_c0_g1~~TRINITY_DN19691_c0_g1_i1.p1  ORF type:complete len:520 (+),score=64.32 TRINITY_DN19691_c0_g1_i1:119-1561(+)
MASTGAIPLTAEPDYLPSLLLLWLTVGAAALTTLFCAIDAVAKPRVRLLLHGDVSDNHMPRRTTRRTLFWTFLSRLILCALLAASLFPPLSVAIRFYTDPPLSQLAPDASNVWINRLVRRTLVEYARTHPASAALARAPFGLSARLVTPTKPDPNHVWTWRFVLAILSIVSLIGIVLRLVPSYLPTRKLIPPIILLQPLVWLLISVPAAFVRPSSLPLDSSPLIRKWLDFEYSERPTRIDENRFLDNWFVQMQPHNSPPQPVSQLPNISLTFCTQFNSLLPTTTTTQRALVDPRPRQLQSIHQSSNPISLSRLTPQLAADIFVVYTVGKPSGPDHYRAIAYTCLAVSVAAPILIAQTLRSYILYPLFAFWVFMFILFSLLATPSILRPVAAPFRPAQDILFCGSSYKVLVVDPSTKLIIRADIAIFALTILAAMLQGYRWVKLVEDNAVVSIRSPVQPTHPTDNDQPKDQQPQHPLKDIM